jgi:hypothetical protein
MCTYVLREKGICRLGLALSGCESLLIHQVVSLFQQDCMLLAMNRLRLLGKVGVAWDVSVSKAECALIVHGRDTVAVAQVRCCTCMLDVCMCSNRAIASFTWSVMRGFASKYACAGTSTSFHAQELY